MSNFLPYRKLNRLPNFDYSQNGYYFITICIKYSTKFFGEIKNNQMILNEYGVIVEQCWLNIPEHFKYVTLDEFIVMPNHLHGIIKIYKNIPVPVGTAYMRSLQEQTKRDKMLLPIVMQNFKSAVTRKINKLTNINFQWQKSYYDQIIKNYYSLNCVRKYIKNNPRKWGLDRNNQNDLWM